MYFVLRPKLQSWRNKNLIASSEPLLAACKPHWWLAQPLVQKPNAFKFYIDGKAPIFDNYNCGSGIDMYSHRLVDVIDAFDIKYEAFPSTVSDKKTGKVLDLDYFAFHLLEILPAIDRSKSELVYDEENPESIAAVKKMVLSEECIEQQRLLFRPAEFFAFVLIHEKLKSEFEAHSITGCQYTPLNEFSVGF